MKQRYPPLYPKTYLPNLHLQKGKKRSLNSPVAQRLPRLVFYPKHFVSKGPISTPTPTQGLRGLLKFSDKPNFRAACKFERSMQPFCSHLSTGYRECYSRTKSCLFCMLFGLCLKKFPNFKYLDKDFSSFIPISPFYLFFDIS
ncbi:hypothetical protein CDAR_453851 [Caerostris darwini]|uniref:Uncharacterized protein n=1 Tax=Caerostris darwini TaxID=1538125 RepID=A0AAV4UMU5_9ARAC|nr:hypothetical protein CDAR_453851 [Caerostris darwini]